MQLSSFEGADRCGGQRTRKIPNPILARSTTGTHPVFLAATIAVLLLCRSSDLAAQPIYQVITNLTNIGLNTTLGGLVRGADGSLYGTSGGGANGCGAIY